MALIRGAIISSILVVVLGATSATIVYTKSADQAASETDALNAARTELAIDKGLLAQEHAIRNEIHILSLTKGDHAKRVLIDRARAIKSISVRDFSLDPNGTKFTMKLAGKYGDIVAASVTIPASDPGVALSSLRIDADATAGHDKAIATLSGAFVQL